MDKMEQSNDLVVKSVVNIENDFKKLSISFISYHNILVDLALFTPFSLTYSGDKSVIFSFK